MEKVDLRFNLRDDRSGVVMTICTGGEERIRTQWSNDDIDGLIQVLANLRAKMSIGVPDNRVASSFVKSVIEPKFSIAKGDGNGRIILSLQHPGFGWTDWDLSKIAIADLLSSMILVLKS